MSEKLSGEDIERLEEAADQLGRLHIIVHPDGEKLAAAAAALAAMISAERPERIEAERSRWTINDSRRSIQAASRDGGPLICHIRNASGRDLDPLLLETERPGTRPIILTTPTAPAATLRGRGCTTFLTQKAPGRRRSGRPDLQRMRGILQEDLAQAGALLRQQPDTAWGARLADSILRCSSEADLPDELRTELLLQRLERRTGQSDSDARSETSSNT